MDPKPYFLEANNENCASSQVLGRAGLVLACGAKGSGPDRLGFGLWGQGSWAGPAWFWLGGPRVLGRAGLVLILRLDTAFIFHLDNNTIIFHLDIAINLQAAASAAELL